MSKISFNEFKEMLKSFKWNTLESLTSVFEEKEIAVSVEDESGLTEVTEATLRFVKVSSLGGVEIKHTVEVTFNDLQEEVTPEIFTKEELKVVGVEGLNGEEVLQEIPEGFKVMGFQKVTLIHQELVDARVSKATL